MVEVIGNEQEETVVLEGVETPVEEGGETFWDSVLATLAVFGAPLSEAEAVGETRAAGGKANEVLVGDAIKAQDTDPSVVATNVEEQSWKTRELTEVGDFFLESYYSVGDTGVNAIDARFETNWVFANTFLDNVEANMREDKSYLERGLDIADMYILRLPKLMFEDLTFRQKKEGGEFLNAMITLPPTEFNKFLEGKVSDGLREGVLRSETLTSISVIRQELNSFGEDDDAAFKFIMSFVDVATLGAGAVTSSTVRRLAKGVGSSVSNRVAIRKGPVAGANAAESILEATDDLEAAASLGPRAADTATGSGPRPVLSRVMENETVARTVAAIDDVLKRSEVKLVDDGAVGIFVRKTAQRMSHEVDRVVMDFDLVDGVLTVDFGNFRTGAPVTKATAVKLADGFDGARVVPVDEAKNMWKVQYSERVNMDEFIPALQRSELEILSGKVNTVVGRFFNAMGRPLTGKLTAGSYIRDAPINSGLANRAEALNPRLKLELKPMVKDVSRLNFKERSALSQIYAKMQSGEELAKRKTRLTDSEVSKLYYQITGEAASDRFMKGFKSLAAIEDISWVYEARRALTGAARKGFWSVEIRPGMRGVGKRVEFSAIPADAKIFDSRFDGIVKKVDFKDDPARSVWEVVDEVEGARYVTDAKNVRMLEPEDVFGYNVGGHRSNPRGKFFVFIDGVNQKFRKTILTTFTEKEAKLALTQIGNIRRAIASGSDDIDAVIARNNDWNTDITSRESFERFVGEEKWNLTSTDEVRYKGRDEKITHDEGGISSFFDGNTYGDIGVHSSRREDKPLMHFGGMRTHNDDPVKAIFGQTSGVTRQLAYKQHTDRTKVAIGKLMAELVGDPTAAKYGGDFRRAYKEIVLPESATGEAKRLNELKVINDRRSGVMRGDEKWVEDFTQGLTDFVFDRTKGRIDIDLSRPADKLNTIGFQSVFGLWSPAQAIVQTAHLLPLTAGAANGFKGASMGWHMRKMLTETDPDTLSEAFRRFAKAYDMPEEDMKELFTLLKDSGRTIVEADTVYRQSAINLGWSGFAGDSFLPNSVQSAKFNASKAVGYVADKGISPFMWGESIPRIAGIATAFLDWKQLKRGASALDGEALTWISNREQALTFHMTNASRGALQHGLTKVPTQWWSYNMRSFEAIFVGRDLTGPERARMAFALGPLFGLEGLGAASAADWLGEKMGLEPGGEAYIAMKYGAIDGMIQHLTPFEIPLGPRLTPMSFISQTYQKIQEGSVYEVAFGPSGQISADIVKSIGDLANGHRVSIGTNSMNIMRNFTTINNAAKAVGILNNGFYRSKSGYRVPGEMDIFDAISVGAGLGYSQVTEWFKRSG